MSIGPDWVALAVVPRTVAENVCVDENIGSGVSNADTVLASSPSNREYVTSVSLRLHCPARSSGSGATKNRTSLNAALPLHDTIRLNP